MIPNLVLSTVSDQCVIDDGCVLDFDKGRLWNRPVQTA